MCMAQGSQPALPGSLVAWKDVGFKSEDKLSGQPSVSVMERHSTSTCNPRHGVALRGSQKCNISAEV